MKQTIIAILSAAAAAAFGGVHGNAGPEDWANAPMGIRITDVTAEKDGIGVSFVTDVPPPYRVGVHLPYEVGLCRARPVAYTDTWTTNAFVYGKFNDVAVFVQVYKPDRRNCPGFTRKMTDFEWERYVSEVHRHPARETRNVGYYEDPSDAGISGIDPAHLQVVGDGTWCGFILTNATEIAYSVQVIGKAHPGSADYQLTTNTVSLSASRSGPDAGSGFRIVAFPDSTPASFLTQAAYSAKTNMSQEVLLKRGWRSLSSNGEWKFTTDWEGAPIMVPCTNAEPYRIYGEGL